ncbi:Cytochrome c oxidase polypeptide 4 [Corynebacterium occultum]|uniref:Cytochrome c oxidase polypeptide 4 n=1 Tax=Corynebacterium occultum TaxID=2675219 RepID=A0A6B8WAH4_9CORY|nr:cytochrome c oxidase subunit 4 [Corynebacterium occultum]QGU07836.1 Cytochrome c oxidase polypeptide 4 [Corynebacterium occultum]
MNSSAKIMYSLSAFLAVTALIYIFGTTYMQDDSYLRRTEWVGVVGLVLGFGLTTFLGVYFHFTHSRSDVLPEDWEEAEVQDKAGTLGFFSPGSIWPAAMSGAILLLGLGIAFWLYWLIALGALLLIYTAAMMNLQYGIPKEKH